MKSFVCVFLAVLFFGYGSGFADEKTGGLTQWLKDLRSVVEKIVPRKAPSQNTTAVSGVRGADADSGDSLYWRGKKENISEEELSEFSAALELAEEGKKDDAIKRFESFLQKYPSSALAGDARITINKLQNS